MTQELVVLWANFDSVRRYLNRVRNFYHKVFITLATDLVRLDLLGLKIIVSFVSLNCALTFPAR